MTKLLAPVAFFGYNRPLHTRQVLQSLKYNKLAADSVLYIFIDGLKPDASEADRKANEAVKQAVREQQWCREVIIEEFETNQGLIKANAYGVTKVINAHGRMIAIEDDNLLSPGFLQYMNDALDLYENNPGVMHIAAYRRPDLLKADVKESTYFFYHTTTWGWATWKRAWDHFTLDATAVRNAVKKKGNISKLNMDNTYEFFWGLKAVAKGKLRSWNCIWHSVVFLNDGFCLYPQKSLVSNIGHDGSGTNCEPDERFAIHTEELALAIPVTPIPLKNHEGIRKTYIGLHSFGYRFIFIVKHYLRYLLR